MAYVPRFQSVSELLRARNPELAELTIAERIARAQTVVRKHVPLGVSLSDELIAERRLEAAREH
jgi:tRNA isopentenyl-2-thiomethyl-A-37 hydroxylase MiaE